ncbi:SDR family oxidoreductase [Chloroflexota bacterium]
MVKRLEGKVALVTGAARGIGRACALTFAREGAKVVVNDLLVEDGEETVHMIKKAGGEAIFIEADVSKEGEVEGLVKTVVDTYGCLDCGHNNAGVEGITTPITECTEANWNQVIGVNLKGVFLCMKYEIRQMLKQGSGAIVNTSSVAGLVGLGMGVSPYIASKHGVIGLTKGAALEFAKAGIRVNAVCPGGTLTEMVQRYWDADPSLKEYATMNVPMGRMADPMEIAEAVVWLCSDAASFVTGHAMAVDGGFIVQ